MEENKNDEDNKPTISNHQIDGITPAPKKKLLERLKIFWSKPKNRILTEVILGIIIIALVGIILLRWYNDQNKTASTTEEVTKTQELPPEEKVAGILDGVPTSPALASRHPLGIIVENHSDARPQYGVSLANIVYEAIAEGGITRYLCLYSSQDASKVGPIRSARTYFVNIVREYSAYFAHVGGNYDALQQIIADKILDLDQFRNAGSYYRDNSSKVSSEHTMFSSTDKLYSLATQKGYSTNNSFSPLKFKTDALAADRGISQKITVDFGSNTYKVVWDYDASRNAYLRTLAGQPDQDKLNGQRLIAKNIIIQEVSRTATTTAINEKGYNFQLTGSGTAKILRDGKLVLGRWQKSSATDRTIFSDESGQEIQLNPGQTWVEIVHPELKVSVE